MKGNKKRSLQELNLIDNFLFGATVSHPIYGQHFGKILLKVIFGREFENLKIIPQKEYYPAETTLHGARLDVYLEDMEETSSATIYDVEPDKRKEKADRKSLPKRVRFYHAMIDLESLKSGQSYEDGAKTIYLYTKGTEGDSPEAVRELLHLMDGTETERISNRDVRELSDIVGKVKKDSEVSVRYMKIFEEEMYIRKEAMEEGHALGRLEGYKENICDLLSEMGAVPDDLKSIIFQQEDISVLKKWHIRAAKAKSIKEFTEIMGENDEY